MELINFSTVRANFKSVCDKVADEKEDVIITRKNSKNLVMISIEKYNYFMKLVEKNNKMIRQLNSNK